MSNPKIGFEFKRMTLSLDAILPIRQLKDPESSITRYSTIRASIREVGVIEPLMVYPQKGNPGYFLIMDGHLRYYALKELKIDTVECLVSTEDESFTYNAKISRLSPIQEHAMIMKAVKNGVTPERIAAALNLNVRDVRNSMNLLDGIHEEAIFLLKEKPICPAAIRILKRVKAVRQIEMAELMVSANTYAKGYVAALLMGTPKDQLANPEKPKTVPGMTSEEIARMEQEMEILERDFKAIEENYGENMLNLTLARGYVKKLLENSKAVRFLTSKHQDVFSEFEAVAATEGL
jgi:ParB-like chromosome segregation protein Spo0J